MPASLKDLKNRIKVVKNTQQITKAMQLVSASKFAKAQAALKASTHYYEHLERMIAEVSRFISDGYENPLLNKQTSGHAAVLVLSSEKGLCGSYNANAAKNAFSLFDSLDKEGLTYTPFCVGKKSFQLLRKNFLNKNIEKKPLFLTHESYLRNKELYTQKDSILLLPSQSKLTHPFVKNISEMMSGLIKSKKLSRVYIAYNSFVSALVQEPKKELYFPYEIKKQELIGNEPILEPKNPEDLFERLLPHFLEAKLYKIFIEVLAGEHGARMTSMDNATRNAKEMEHKLKITYQRARQAAITNELIEIISGAEAL
jgi:F-type H+-transporting ATPase subunit gamma